MPATFEVDAPVFVNTEEEDNADLEGEAEDEDEDARPLLPDRSRPDGPPRIRDRLVAGEDGEDGEEAGSPERGFQVVDREGEEAGPGRPGVVGAVAPGCGGLVRR